MVEQKLRHILPQAFSGQDLSVWYHDNLFNAEFSCGSHRKYYNVVVVYTYMIQNDPSNCVQQFNSLVH